MIQSRDLFPLRNKNFGVYVLNGLIAMKGDSVLDNLVIFTLFSIL